jgi:periplasmic copper chaperone A
LCEAWRGTKKSKFHYKDTKDTKVRKQSFYLESHAAATGVWQQIQLFESELRALCVFVVKFLRLSAIGYWLFSLAIVLLGAPSLLADDQSTITVQHPWMRAVPDVMDSTAVYMTLVNSGSTSAELVGGSTSVAGSVAPMITTKQGEGTKQTVGMQGVDSLKIPAHGTLVLEPNGNHLMVMGLKEHPKEGTQVDFTIKLEPGDHEIHLKIPVSRRPVKWVR